MTLAPVMTADELNAFLDAEFPQINAGGRYYSVISVTPGEAELRLDPDQSHIRPGGTISGPTLFSLADLASYAVILAHVGPVALAVTTNLNINFLRKPQVAPIVGTARLLKLGKRLAVVDTTMHPAAGSELVAQATATYSIPPR
ncbi:PaaI family thioesterase [Pseudohoeflea coraliihabitans]|uniref:PaaI family thioesterase n=1 Tax=Pseudohoeflea coraliihabitans TaxID=2860393 RepID=A0ABS6WTP2_9HYPH|nr:PaaI family thioesterase [Pseudohoeflea sp. DP4N28-3]MBW3098802.1 PaaI family thioesterase [Pseudohoeflea sp. DP4N28-3]